MYPSTHARLLTLGFARRHSRIAVEASLLPPQHLHQYSCHHKGKLDQVNCAKVKYSHYIVYLKNLHPLKKITLEKYSSLKASRPWKIFTHEKYSPLKNNHPWKIFTPEKYSPLKNIHSWKYSPRINIHSWKIVTPEKYSLLENWKIFTPKKYSLLENIDPWKNIQPQ